MTSFFVKKDYIQKEKRTFPNIVLRSIRYIHSTTLYVQTLDNSSRPPTKKFLESHRCTQGIRQYPLKKNFGMKCQQIDLQKFFFEFSMFQDMNFFYVLTNVLLWKWIRKLEHYVLLKRKGKLNLFVMQLATDYGTTSLYFKCICKKSFMIDVL